MNVKWGKEKFSDVECNTDEPPEVFKAQLFALSGVQPDRQKVMMKGAVLKVVTLGLTGKKVLFTTFINVFIKQDFAMLYVTDHQYTNLKLE